MRSLQFILRGCILCLGLGLCYPSIAAPRMIAIASIFPVADIAQEIGGERWEVLTLLPAGASAHTYEPTPEQVRQFVQAGIFFRIGLGLEFWVEKLVRVASNSALRNVDLSEGIETLPTPAPALPATSLKHGHRGAKPKSHPVSTAKPHTHQHTGPDAHYWLDPIRMMHVVTRITQEFSQRDPDGTTYYAERAQGVRANLEQLHSEIMQRTEVLVNRRFIALHAAWTYFAPRYNLVQAAVVEPFPGREPSPKYLADLAQFMRREQVQAVVLEPQLSTTAAQALARETGARVGLLDPYGGSGIPERDSYLTLMRYNVAALVKLLE